jgi:ATP-dependent helicase/nuclease subunit B
VTAENGLYTIPLGAAFVDALAAGVLTECDGAPLTLARYTILLPTRRACRALREAFLRVTGGRPLLLPRMQAIGDVEPGIASFGEALGIERADLAPAIAETRRLLLLARRILAWNAAREAGSRTEMTPDHAVRLADELARLIDRVQTERLSFDALATLAPLELAEHWQRTLDFLQLVTRDWPEMLQAEGCLDPAERRNGLLQGLAESWEARPPSGPVIAAGSTGSVPATADLFAVIARLPQGRVVLPGLDRQADTETWDAIRLDQTHPQYGMARLLDRLEIDRAAVRDWPIAAEHRHAAAGARTALLAEALRPAETTDRWQALGGLATAARKALRSADDGASLTRVVCAGDKEEGEVIALLLRHALETDGKTAALVTPDRRLARRVAASLGRWGIAIDDSAGMPLDRTAPGVFFRQVAEVVAEGFAPVALLSLVKHPLAATGMAPATLRRAARLLERWVLRGPKPAAGLGGLRNAVQAAMTADREVDRPDAEAAAEMYRLIDALAAALEPMAALWHVPSVAFAAIVEAHIRAAEAFAASADETGPVRLWSEEAGEALAEFLNGLLRAGDALPPIPPASYPDMLEALMAGQAVRPRYGRHPRLHIWGPLEARLQQADLVVLGGLNEGVWPGDPAPDPWMSRPMQGKFGLPLPERRIGLAAHDFVQLAAAREVVLTRAEKTDGTPTVPSRWLLRLETVLKGCGLADDFAPDTSWLGLQRGLIAVDGHCPVDAPAPRPPVAARPRRLSVTRVETWMRDPYSIYAREILRLRPLDPLESDPGAADRGTIVHAALDRFLRDCPGALPADALDRLLAIGREVFAETIDRPAVRAFWWPRFARIAAWFVDREREGRAQVAASRTEVSGKYEIAAPAGPFTLSAHADRVDRSVHGRLSIIDYKTGAVPSAKQIEAGFAPQLPLEAVIAEAGGFADVAAAPVERLAHWRLSGGAPPGAILELGDDVSGLAAEAREKLLRLIAAFDDPATPYVSTPEPDWPPPYPEYDHLARLREWLGVAGGDS